jgi:hypothetical protein
MFHKDFILLVVSMTTELGFTPIGDEKRLWIVCSLLIHVHLDTFALSVRVSRHFGRDVSRTNGEIPIAIGTM